ncbi:MAG TPA: OmpA family protein [Xanthobacteraceae bacterium]|nr:OmpA family protein [Xanthobacteraceae bacterium]
MLEGLLSPSSGDTGVDRKALAGLLLEIAQSLKPELRAQQNGMRPADLRLEQLRTLLLGREIEVLSRLTDVMDDPERLAAAVGRVLPSAIAQATTDARMGHVLAPAMEKATESSIRSDPHTLVNILYPLIVPAIRKSIGETIDETFQSLNQSLKYSLTWRGLKWRWEAWRTGMSFAEVVLKHTLVYQVEHVFLIHRHTGLLISHVAAENAASQDPQLVSSMLVAIQDFVKDSFSGAEQQGLDALRLGELRLWSEMGPFATLVAVIRGDPPEELHDTLRNVLSRIHAERHHALESFDGDSSGFADVEAQLRECVSLAQRAPPRASLRWLVGLIWFVPLLLFAVALEARWWQDQRLWEGYLERLRLEPGIVITELGKRDGKFMISGLRDPLAVDPQLVLRQAEMDPTRVIASWVPYQGLDPESVLRRLKATLDPPPSVSLAVADDRIVAQGSAPRPWLERARAVAQALPAGSPGFDLSGVRNADEADERRWADYLARLRAQPGIVTTQADARDGKFVVAGLRDPLAADPQVLLSEAGIDPARVAAHFEPYQSLDPAFVLKRLQSSLAPPPGLSLAVEGDHIVAQGSASSPWIERARVAGRMLPAGAPALDLSAVRNINDGEIGKLRDTIQARNIRFDNNVALPAAGQGAILDQQASDLNALAALSTSLHVTTRVTLTGHSDDKGQGTSNLSLSLARAEAVRALLKKRGVDPDLLAVRGAGPLEPVEADSSETARAANRRVSFTVGIEDQQ